MSLEPEAFAHVFRSELENNRSVRYRSEEQAVAFEAFSPEDQAIIRRLYDLLSALDRTLEHGSAGALQTFLAQHDVDRLVDTVRRLGAVVTDPRLAAAIHDIRGGALTSVLVQLRRRDRLANDDLARGVSIATRDHMKIIRNVVRDLDPAARARDLAMIPHTLGELAAALRSFHANVGGQTIVADVACADANAVIAENCVECAAIDRVAYNLVNNAAVHATAPRIQVWLAPLPHDVRVAVANPISPAHGDVVRGMLDDDPAALFGSFTTSGSGQGLRIVGELVGRAYGIARLSTLLEAGHIGVSLVADCFLAWFHWPLARASTAD